MTRLRADLGLVFELVSSLLRIAITHILYNDTQSARAICFRGVHGVRTPTGGSFFYRRQNVSWICISSVASNAEKEAYFLACIWCISFSQWYRGHFQQ